MSTPVGMQQARSYRNAAIRDLYRSSLLKEIARCALTIRDDAIFAEFHRKTIEELFEGAKVDFLAVSAIKVDQRLQPVGGFDCVPLGLPGSIVDHYEKVVDVDVIAPVIYGNPGRIVANTDVISEDAWLDHPFFRDHCRIYDIRRAMMIGFLYPGHVRKFIAIEYLGSPDNASWSGVDPSQLELASFPFALAWLCRKGAIDDAELARNFNALRDLTAGELALLRKYVNSPYQELSEQARDMGGRSVASYKNSLYDLRDKLAGRFDWERSEGEPRRKSLRPLDADYAFLRLLGNAASPLILP